MPGGPLPLGLVYFGGIKFVGYTAAAAFLKWRLPETKARAVIIGGVRTAIGFAAGFGTIFVGQHLGIYRSDITFYALLAPIRMCEWLLLLALFFRLSRWDWPRSLKFALLGTVWSYLLDIPAVLAVFSIPGGAWIC